MMRKWTLALLLVLLFEIGLVATLFFAERGSERSFIATTTEIRSGAVATSSALERASTSTTPDIASSSTPLPSLIDRNDTAPLAPRAPVLPGDAALPSGVPPQLETTPLSSIAGEASTPPGGASSTFVALLSDDEEGALTRMGIFVLVNAERAKEGLSPLSYNATLSAIAEVKALDMITRAYFAHESPDGIDVSGLAERYHYDYINVGENLAMGDFVSDADVVRGWMNSPGHRANILNPLYTEIGIAAVYGRSEGRMMWFAVQAFGRPASLCPQPNDALAAEIKLYEAQLSTIETTLATIREELASGRLDRSVYNTKVDEYNALVETYNTLITTTKEAIARYNATVEAFNACIAS